MKKKLLAIALAAFMAISVTACSDGGTETETEATTTTEATTAAEPEDLLPEGAGFKVDGTKLLDANGNEFVLRGINHPHAWFKDQLETAYDAIAETGSNSIRIVLGSGVQYGKTNMKELERVIRNAKERDMIAVVEVHCITGSDSIDDLLKVTDFWIEMKDVLAGTEAYCILNIANEWVGKWDSTIWRDGYTQAIPKLREAGIKNTIMVDSAGWGQYAKCVQDYGMEVFESDPDRNTMFSVHMYGAAGKNSDTIEAAIKGATDQGLCIIVGEFGYNHSDGDVDEAYIMQYCTDNNIGYMGWSWKGNGGGVEYLDIANEWDGSVLSPDWGENLINGATGIKATSEICSIFEDAA